MSAGLDHAVQTACVRITTVVLTANAKFLAILKSASMKNANVSFV